MTQNTKLAVRDDSFLDKERKRIQILNLNEIDSIIKDYNLNSLSAVEQMERAILLARGIKQLRAMISDEIMEDILILQNTKLGFLTDNKGGYPPDIVKDCFIEAIFKGLQPTGNEFNIIRGKMYVTKEGYIGLLKRYDGFSDLKTRYKIPKFDSQDKKGVIIPYEAEWKLHGKTNKMAQDIVIPNKGAGIEAILGKGERRIRALIYAEITGSHALNEGDIDDVNIIDVEPHDVKDFISQENRSGEFSGESYSKTITIKSPNKKSTVDLEEL